MVITFDEAMDTWAAGTVQLNGLPALAAGTWSNGNTTYTAPYSGLAASTPYTVNISGFADAAGNVMNADNSHNFTTTSLTPTGIAIHTQPKSAYTLPDDNLLDLSALVITITYNDLSTENVPFAQFGDYGITTTWTYNPSVATHGQTLSSLLSSPITVTYGSLTANTAVIQCFIPYFIADGEYYASITFAVAAVPNGGTITMLRNLTMGSTTGFSQSKTYTINLGGYTISGAGSLSINAGTVTVENGTIDVSGNYGLRVQSGTVTVKSGNYRGNYGGYCSSGSVEIVSGVFTRSVSGNECISEISPGSITLAAGSSANVSPWKNNNVPSIAVSTTQDVIPPTITAASVSATTTNTATLNFTSDEAGMYYYIVLPSGINLMDAATVKTRVGDGGVTDPKGSGIAVAGTNVINVSGLSVFTSYRAWLMVEDAAGNLSAAAMIAFSTNPTPNTDVSTSITFVNGSDVYTGLEFTHETASIGFSSANSPSWIYTYTAATDRSATGNETFGGSGKPVNAGNYEVTATYTDADGNYGSKTAAFTVNKAAQSAPAAPVLVSKTESSILVTGLPTTNGLDFEVGINTSSTPPSTWTGMTGNGASQSCPFASLTPDTYYIFVRISESDNYTVSSASSALTVVVTAVITPPDLVITGTAGG